MAPFFFLLSREHQPARACNGSRNRVNVAFLRIDGGIYQRQAQSAIIVIIVREGSHHADGLCGERKVGARQYGRAKAFKLAKKSGQRHIPLESSIEEATNQGTTEKGWLRSKGVLQMTV